MMSNKEIKNSQLDVEAMSHDTSVKHSDRRDFFRKAALSMGALAGTSLFANKAVAGDDPAIVHHVPWGQKWGDPVTKIVTAFHRRMSTTI
jgi:hypothetical protein